MPNTIGENIRRTRNIRKISINTLAKIANVSLGYLSDLENGKMNNPSDKVLEAIAEALNVTSDYLRGLSITAVIEQRLEALNMPLDVLCKKTGLSEQYLLKLDTIIPTPDDYANLTKIAEALEMPQGPLIAALARQEPPLDTDDYEVIDARDVFTINEDGISLAPQALRELGIGYITHRKTLAALRTDGYEEPLTEDEAKAVKAFLESYRKLRDGKSEK